MTCQSAGTLQVTLQALSHEKPIKKSPAGTSFNQALAEFRIC
jgi:hypothetical protein